MGVERLLAKMSVRGLAITGGGFGGVVELSWTDVAAGLGGLDRVTTELLRTMYLDDHRGDALVLAELRRVIREIAGRHEVKVTEPVVAGLAVLVMFEVINPPQCGPCSSTGLIRHRGGIIRTCDKCCGTGIGQRGIREQAGIAGLKKDTFNNKYSRVAAVAYAECSRWLDQGLRHLSRRMADVA